MIQGEIFGICLVISGLRIDNTVMIDNFCVMLQSMHIVDTISCAQCILRNGGSKSVTRTSYGNVVHIQYIGHVRFLCAICILCQYGR